MVVWLAAKICLPRRRLQVEILCPRLGRSSPVEQGLKSFVIGGSIPSSHHFLNFDPKMLLLPKFCLPKGQTCLLLARQSMPSRNVGSVAQWLDTKPLARDSRNLGLISANYRPQSRPGNVAVVFH